MSDRRIKVLYITGMSRSGTTILGNILGQAEGHAHFGEIHELFWHADKLLKGQSLCGCGRPVVECEVWKGVVEEVFGGFAQIRPEEMRRLARSAARIRYIPSMMTRRGRSRMRVRADAFLQVLYSLYSSLQRVTGAKIIVDSSKTASYGYVLSMTPGIEVYPVHTVRDPRAVAFSWMRPKYDPSRKRRMETRGPLWSALYWVLWTPGAERVWRSSEWRNRYLQIRYEDLVKDPRKSLGEIMRLVGKTEAALPLVDDRSVRIGPSHVIAGNPGRFDRGIVTLRPDLEWSSSMKTKHRLAVTAATWPWLRRYGYRVRSRPRSIGADQNVT